MRIKPPIFITAAKRTPIGKYQGMFKNIPAPILGRFAIEGLQKQSSLSIEKIEMVTLGCVLPAGLGQAPARQAALAAGLSVHTPCITVNKMCGSGMQAIIQTCDAIRAETVQTGIAGGFENMSRADQTHMMQDGLEDAYEKGKSMGIFAEQCAAHYHFTRAMQDAFATESLKRAQTAQRTGAFASEIAAVSWESEHYDSDEGPHTAKAEKIPALKPSFQSDGTITAANASSISDGAAALLLTGDPKAPALAKILAYTTYAQSPNWFTTAPITAIQQLLDSLSWTVDDVDLFEINEAFAVVTLAAMQTLKIPHHKVNIHGGACILGHPIGASGARILVTLLYALKQKGLKRGIASLCIGGGEAQAVAIELI